MESSLVAPFTVVVGVTNDQCRSFGPDADTDIRK